MGEEVGKGGGGGGRKIRTSEKMVAFPVCSGVWHGFSLVGCNSRAKERVLLPNNQQPEMD